MMMHGAGVVNGAQRPMPPQTARSRGSGLVPGGRVHRIPHALGFALPRHPALQQQQQQQRGQTHRLLHRRAQRLLLLAHSHTKEPLALVQLQTSRSMALLSRLASSWAKIASRLPSSGLEQVERILAALKLSFSWLDGLPPKADGRSPSTRAVQLAATLADLSAAGLPLDADAIAAGILLEAADVGYLDYDTIHRNLGGDVAMLVRDVIRVRTAPQRLQLYDDKASSAIREWCVAFNDVRASVVEVVSRWDELHHIQALPLIQRQTLAMEALQVYAPLGHALGMGAISSSMEDICFKELFPEPYHRTARWLEAAMEPAERALYAAQQQLLAALSAHPHFSEKASGCVLRTRTKSLFSMMKKMVRLSKQGKQASGQVFDLLGIRAVVQPREDLPEPEAEAAAVEACYIIESVAKQLWQVVPERTKDYISRPKPNGYRSVHLTVHINSIVLNDMEGRGRRSSGSVDEGEHIHSTQASSFAGRSLDDTDTDGTTSGSEMDEPMWNAGSSGSSARPQGGNATTSSTSSMSTCEEGVWDAECIDSDSCSTTSATSNMGTSTNSSSSSSSCSRFGGGRGTSWRPGWALDLHPPTDVVADAEVVRGGEGGARCVGTAGQEGQAGLAQGGGDGVPLEAEHGAGWAQRWVGPQQEGGSNANKGWEAQVLQQQHWQDQLQHRPQELQQQQQHEGWALPQPRLRTRRRQDRLPATQQGTRVLHQQQQQPQQRQHPLLSSQQQGQISEAQLQMKHGLDCQQQQHGQQQPLLLSAAPHPLGVEAAACQPMLAPSQLKTPPGPLSGGLPSMAAGMTGLQGLPSLGADLTKQQQQQQQQGETMPAAPQQAVRQSAVDAELATEPLLASNLGNSQSITASHGHQSAVDAEMPTETPAVTNALMVEQLLQASVLPLAGPPSPTQLHTSGSGSSSSSAPHPSFLRIPDMPQPQPLLSLPLEGQQQHQQPARIYGEVSDAHSAPQPQPLLPLNQQQQQQQPARICGEVSNAASVPQPQPLLPLNQQQQPARICGEVSHASGAPAAPATSFCDQAGPPQLALAHYLHHDQQHRQHQHQQEQEQQWRKWQWQQQQQQQQHQQRQQQQWREPFSDQGSEATVAFLELQIRTQEMDDRAESGMAAHSAYKGGLDYKQVRQLQAWAQELQHRLAARPQKKLMLPPSITARHMGAALDSVDLDGEDISLPLCWDVQASAVPPASSSTPTTTTASSAHATTDTASSSTDCTGNGIVEAECSDVTPATSAVSAAAAAAAQPGAGPAIEAMVENSTSISSSSSSSSTSFVGGKGSGRATSAAAAEDVPCIVPTDWDGTAATSPAEVLFSFIDTNGDGRVSVDELRSTLAELSSSKVPWAAPQGGISASNPSSNTTSTTTSSSSSSSSSSSMGDAASAGGTAAHAESEKASAPDANVDVDVAGLVQLVASGADGAQELSLPEFVELLRKARQARKLKHGSSLADVKRKLERG